MAQVIKKQFPGVRIAMLIQRYTSEIVEENGDVDHVLFYDNGERPLPFFHLIETIRSERFDTVFHTHPRFHLALLTWLAGIPVRVGTGYRWYSFLFNRKVYEHRKDAKRHELEYNLNLLQAIGCAAVAEAVVPRLAVKEQALESVKSLLSGLGVRESDQVVILHPGSGKSARDWQVKNFGTLARRLSALPDVKIVITGGRLEQNIVREVQTMAGESAIALVNQLNLKEYSALAKCSALFIANSTGPIHIAAAVGTPVIGLYPQVTPLSAARWGPYTPLKTIFSPAGQPLDCTRCIDKKENVCACMETISVEEVYQAALKYIMKD